MTEFIKSRYAVKRVYNTYVKGKLNKDYIKSEWVEFIDKDDERYQKLFYRPVGAKMAYNPNRINYETNLP